MRTKKLVFLSFAIIAFLIIAAFSARPLLARTNVTDWYIENFDSEITVNKDSSLDITEKITADCGNAVGKHGIFRILPENIKIGGENIKTPVELLSITDFSGQPLKYIETRNRSDATVTWKIGDPNRTVQGVNYYLIRYRVKNTIRFDNSKFDELYWNLTGNFWDLEIDNFSNNLILPPELNRNNVVIDYYTGDLGSKKKDLATYSWPTPNTLKFNSTRTLGLRQGITASLTFPKNIFTPYEPSFWEKYGKYSAVPLPFLVFFVSFYFWWKYGKDPRVDKTVIAEYDVPENISPIEMGMLMNNGKFNNKWITAEIVNLATKNFLTIKEINENFLFFKHKDYELTKIDNAKPENTLNPAQQSILNRIFEDGGTVKLSDLKNEFYKSIKDIKKKTKNFLVKKKLIVASGLALSRVFIIIGFIIIGGIFIFGPFGVIYIASFLLSGLIVLIFGFLMPKRTPLGAELNWQIKGFKLFMETVDKHRAEFYEKENIFEKFLPYAIIFGITELWIKKMKEIYGEDYYARYAPAWYAGNAAAFDADSFSSAIDSLSSSIAANTSSPSGSGGGGGAGGGGGGGGGGGW